MSFINPAQHIAELGISSGMCVADLGAGVGYYALECGKAVSPEGVVIAIDAKPDVLSRLARDAQDQGLNIMTIVSDLEQERGTTLKDETLDMAILSNTLFQIKQKARVLEEIYRVLKPNGKLLCVDWRDSHGGAGPDEEQRVPLSSMYQLLESSGFIPEREVSAGDFHYGLIVGK